MSEQKPPRPRVTSLVDRLPPARRAVLALRNHLHDRGQLNRIGAMAERFARVDTEGTLAMLSRMPMTRENLDARINCLAVQGAQRFLNNDAEGAFEAWAAVIAEHPADATPVLHMRSSFHVMRGDLEAALADVTHALELCPTRADSYTRRGDLLHRMNRDPEAMANYRRAAQLDRRDLHAQTGMAMCLLMAEQHEEALPWYGRAIRLAPADADLRFERALCHENLERYAEAVADLDAAIRLEPKEVEFYYARGRCRPEDQRAAAIADFTRALDLDPALADVWAVRGSAHFMNGAPDAALADAERALALDPDLADAYFTRALVRHQRRDLAGARADYEQAMKLAPEEPIYAMGRDRLLGAMGEIEGG